VAHLVQSDVERITFIPLAVVGGARGDGAVFQAEVWHEFEILGCGRGARFAECTPWSS